MVIPAGYGKSKLFKLRPLHTDLKEELNDGLEFKDEGEVMLAQSEFNVLNVKLVRRPLPEPIKHAVEAVKTLQRNVVLQFQRFIPPSSVLDKSPFYEYVRPPLPSSCV